MPRRSTWRLAAALMLASCGGRADGPAPPVPEAGAELPGRIGSPEALRFRGDAGRRQFEAAEALRLKGDFAAALAEYNKLLPLEVKPLGPEEWPDYDSLDHWAALAMSECFESLGRLDRALEMALLARDRFRFYDPAGSTVQAAKLSLAQRIESLEKRLAAPEKPYNAQKPPETAE